MALRDIIILPDKRLRLVSEPVKKFDAGIRKLVDDMLETMYDAPGIGLAAIQIAVAERVVIMDLRRRRTSTRAARLRQSGNHLGSEEKATYEEGCLSIPEYYEEVERPATVRVRYLDLEGKRTRKRPTACSRPASSTRSTTSTACCSSTTFPG